MGTPGRKKMTEDQKAANKAAREAATTNATAKADRAEARANGQPGAQKPAPAPAPAARVNSDDLDREEKALFLNHHLPAVRKARDAVGKATADLRNAYKKAKAEGNFTKADFDTAFAVETAENEARERAKIARQLKIARIMGSSLGAQLDMFLEPDRTPAADIAFQEGETDAMQNKAAKPKYDPSTEQYRRYLEGYHGVSAKLIEKGIGKLDPEAAKLAQHEAAEKARIGQQRAQDGQEFEKEPEPAKPAAPVNEVAKAQAAPVAEQQSGVPLTRAQFKAQQEAKAKENAQ